MPKKAIRHDQKTILPLHQDLYIFCSVIFESLTILSKRWLTLTLTKCSLEPSH